MANNELIKLYVKYQGECWDRHEESKSFKVWLSTVYNPPPSCKKCLRVKATLLSKIK